LKQCSAALAVDPEHWRDPDRRPDGWRLETLIHLVRLRAAAGDGHTVGVLVAEFLARAKRTIDSRAQGYGLADSEAIEMEVGDARTIIRQRADRAVLQRKDLPKAHHFLTTEAYAGRRSRQLTMVMPARFP
jgi:hypothetical protein